MERPATCRAPLAAFAPGDVARGASQRFALAIDGGLAADVSLPVLAVGGSQPGPLLLAVAGVHGDEYEGMEAIRRVASALDPAALRGTFVGIPVANPFAYEARSRAVPAHVDGLNLARVFPGNPNGTPTRRLAHDLLALVERFVGPDDLFVDFHSGSADVAFLPVVGFRDVSGPATVAAEAAARRFGLPVWRIPDAPGPFNAETARRGIPTLGTETTGRAGCLDADVAAFERGLHNLLMHKGMLPGAAPEPFAGPARTTVDVLAPASGFLRDAPRLGDEVAAGEPLGTLVTPHGDPIADIHAPTAGTIWAARATPATRAGELVCAIAES
jgi:predicted deacylase